MKNIFLAKSNGKILDFGEYKQSLVEDVKNNKDAMYKLERFSKKRTIPQNNLFWFYLEIIEKETGNSPEDMHEYVKKHLTPKIGRRVRILTKQKKWVWASGMVGKGTSDLNRSEMSDVMDKLCALTGVPIPDKSLASYVHNY